RRRHRLPVLWATTHHAALGGRYGYDHGWQSDYQQDADRQSLSQRRLVLWRLQGDAGIGLVLCPHDRAGSAASAPCAVQPPPVRARLHHRRTRSRAVSRPALRGSPMVIPCPWCGERPFSEFAYGGGAAIERPAPPPGGGGAGGEGSLSLRKKPPGPRRQLWVPEIGFQQGV